MSRAFAFLLTGLLFLLSLTACNIGYPRLAAESGSTITSSPFPSATSDPTHTSTPAPTDTHTPIPSLTPTPTSTPTALFMVLPGTPLPLPLSQINPSNARDVSGLSAWNTDSVTDLAWTPDSRILAVAFPHGISFYEVQTRLLLRSLFPKQIEVMDIAFDPSGTWLVSGSRRGTEANGYSSSIELWLGPDWKPLGPLFGQKRGLSNMEFSPTDPLFVSAFAGPKPDENEVLFWNTNTWVITGALQTGPVLNLAFSPDGQTLATTPDRYALKVWDLKEKDLIYTFHTSFTGAVSQIAFSPAVPLLVSGHTDGMVRIWDLARGALVREFNAGSIVQSIAVSPDGLIIAVGGGFENHLVRLWALETGELLRTLDGHSRGVNKLLFSPDGQVLVSASYDGEIRLWGLRTP